MKTAFEKIYDKMRDRIFRYVYFRVKNTALSEDIASDVFVKLYKEVHLKPEIEKYAEAWCYRVAHNMIVDHFRSHKVKKAVTLSELEAKDSDDEREVDLIDEKNEDALEHEIKDEQLKILMDHVKQLPFHDQELINLRIFDELPFQEIAVILNKTEAAVKMKYKRIIDKLQAEITKL